MKVDIELRTESTQAYATRLVSYVNGLRTPWNNASANALANLPNRHSVLCWMPATHAQTWASYSALYRFGRLSNDLINVDIRTYCVHKLAYYRHDMATYITLFCLYRCSCYVLRRCILSRFSSAVTYLLICNVVTNCSCCGIIGIVRWQLRTQPVSLKVPPTHRPCHRPTGQWRGPVGRCGGGSIKATRMHYRDGWLRVGCGV